MFLKNLQDLQENNCARVSVLIKLHIEVLLVKGSEKLLKDLEEKVKTCDAKNVSVNGLSLMDQTYQSKWMVGDVE